MGEEFTVHVGWDQYVYVGSDRPCADAVARTRELGLFPEPLTASPYAAELDEPEVTQAAHVRNAARWHRLTTENLDTVRAHLRPRALLTLWPDLTPEVGAVLAALPDSDGVLRARW
ncbi:hypothetical protein ACFTWH_06755 [Streptomyces sp. NPDC057011]|uniref:hypothetical protein n=1 Tax=unclassified Streptomyces TaxID=2593676 RepID=UPI00363ED702